MGGREPSKPGAARASNPRTADNTLFPSFDFWCSVLPASRTLLPRLLTPEARAFKTKLSALE
jgi:hypothetical protein